MINRAYILKIFPEIKKIRKTKLRTQVIEAWLLAVKRGGWTRIDKIPFTLLIRTERNLIEHTRIVTRMAMAIANVRPDLDLDTVIAGGITHDVGKLLEYGLKGRKIVKSPCGKLVRHPISGYGVAVEVGLPAEVGHIIAAHSEEGEKINRSAEAILIHHCDFIDFDIEKANTR